jgi:hypothetical protein
MTQRNKQIQIRWENKITEDGTYQLTPTSVVPYNLYKKISFLYEKPEPKDEEEWICQILQDSHPHDHKQGERKVFFVRNALKEWHLNPITPKLYDCQKVEPVYTHGIREIRKQPDVPLHIQKEVETANKQYEEALKRVKHELTPLFENYEGAGEVTIEINQPNLQGQLYSTCEPIVIANWGYFKNVLEFLEEKRGTLYRMWVFKTDNSVCEIGRTICATNLGPQRIILDLEHTIDELGQPSGVRFEGWGLKITWGNGNGELALQLLSMKELHLHHPNLVSKVKGNPLESAIDSLNIGAEIKHLHEDNIQALQKYKKKQKMKSNTEKKPVPSPKKEAAVTLEDIKRKFRSN